MSGPQSTHANHLQAGASGRMARRLLPEVLEVAELALYLGLDVKRLLAPARPPLVAGDDELADLLDELAVGPEATRRALVEEPRELGVDVERRLAPGALAVGLRLEHLADLRLLGFARDGRRAAARLRELAVDPELALADRLEGAPGAEH